LAIYGVYRVKQVIEFWRYSKFPPKARHHFSETELPHVTVQLPLFNEMYVVERLVKRLLRSTIRVIGSRSRSSMTQPMRR
jgi:hypothetical protein